MESTRRRARITVKGKVQMVGFRNFVIDLMKSLNLKGHAKNLSDGSVEIVCEGGKAKIEELSGKMRKTSQPYFAKVDSAELEWQKFIGDLDEPERAGKDVPTKNKEATLNDVVNVLTRMDMKLEVGNERLGSIDNKQELTLSEIHAMRTDMNQNFAKMDEKQDQTIVEIKTMTNDMNQNFDTLNKKYGSLSERMASIDNTMKELGQAILALAGKKS